MEIEKETAGEAASRMRLLISYVEDRIGTEFVYTYSYSTGKLMLVRRGSREDKGGTNIPPPAYLYLRRFLRFCVYGPDTALEVSTRRREDIQNLLGIGKYSKEKW